MYFGAGERDMHAYKIRILGVSLNISLSLEKLGIMAVRMALGVRSDRTQTHGTDEAPI